MQSLHGFYAPICDTFIGPKFKWGPVVQDAIMHRNGKFKCLHCHQQDTILKANEFNVGLIVVAEAHRFIRHIIFSNSLKARLLLTQFLNSIVADQIICLHFSDLKIKISTKLHKKFFN